VALSTFLVERYWPGVRADTHAAAMARGKRTAAALRHEGRQIEYLRSTLVPEQETVLCIFEAETPELVAELNDRAEFHYDRIAEAVAVPASESPTEAR